MRGKIRYWPWLLVILALALAGCSAGGGGNNTSGSDNTAATAPVKSDNQGGQAGQVVITQKDVANGVEMKLGQQAVVKLGDGFNWQLDVTPDMVVSVVKDAPLQSGEQGVLEAKMQGRAVLQATGKPTCASDNPPCATPSAQFNIKINVTP